LVHSIVSIHVMLMCLPFGLALINLLFIG
jgi:hypothetical protein